MQRFPLLLSAALLGGCGTMISGANHEILVESVPQGAKVTMLGNYMGDTPVRVAVPRRGWGSESAPSPDNPTLIVEMAGFTPAVVEMRRYTNPATFLNVVNLFLGMIVDGLTGAYWAYWPDQAHVKLTPVPAGK